MLSSSQTQAVLDTSHILDLFTSQFVFFSSNLSKSIASYYWTCFWKPKYLKLLSSFNSNTTNTNNNNYEDDPNNDVNISPYLTNLILSLIILFFILFFSFLYLFSSSSSSFFLSILHLLLLCILLFIFLNRFYFIQFCKHIDHKFSLDYKLLVSLKSKHIQYFKKVRKTIQQIQEVELVSRGYNLSSLPLLSPITRLEQNTSHFRSLNLRLSLKHSLSSLFHKINQLNDKNNNNIQSTNEIKKEEDEKKNNDKEEERECGLLVLKQLNIKVFDEMTNYVTNQIQTPIKKSNLDHFQNLNHIFECVVQLLQCLLQQKQQIELELKKSHWIILPSENSNLQHPSSSTTLEKKMNKIKRTSSKQFIDHMHQFQVKIKQIKARIHITLENMNDISQVNTLNEMILDYTKIKSDLQDAIELWDKGNASLGKIVTEVTNNRPADEQEDEEAKKKREEEKRSQESETKQKQEQESKDEEEQRRIREAAEEKEQVFEAMIGEEEGLGGGNKKKKSREERIAEQKQKREIVESKQKDLNAQGDFVNELKSVLNKRS